MQLSKARQSASSSIGVMVAMARLIDSSLFRDVLDRKVLPYVKAKLPGLNFRLHKSYSLLLMITNVVRNMFLSQWLHNISLVQQLYSSYICRLLPEHISWGDVKSFFDNMSNEVVRIHSSQRAPLIDSFLEKLSVCLADSPPSEVRVYYMS